MQDLIAQEQFELEVLDRLNSRRLLSSLVFGGGTMLRLCCGLNRFSVDLDFWMLKELDSDAFLKKLLDCLAHDYSIKDSANKFYTLVCELKSKNYPRSLKLEIRKAPQKVLTEQAIAYSRYSTTQVLLTVVSLGDMMKSKIAAFLERKEIRDVFDMEFLFKRGVPLNAPPDTLSKIAKQIEALKTQDYTVKLCSLLEDDQRKYYAAENFKILKLAIREKTGV